MTGSASHPADSVLSMSAVHARISELEEQRNTTQAHVDELREEVDRIEGQLRRLETVREVYAEFNGDTGAATGDDGGANDPCETAGPTGADALDRREYRSVATNSTSAGRTPSRVSAAEVLQTMQAQPDRPWPSSELVACFPHASVSQVRRRLNRLRQDGQVVAIGNGRYHLASTAPPAVSATVSGAAPRASAGTVRSRVLTLLEQDPERGWRPRDLVQAIHPSDGNHLRRTLRSMLQAGQVVQDTSGLYWAVPAAPRASAFTTDLRREHHTSM